MTTFHLPRFLYASHDGEIHIDTDTYKHIGYFAAGGIASVTSRTVTAPLDRLKIYLISSVGTTKVNGNNAAVAPDVPKNVHLGSGIRSACVVLWRSGGIRSLWAGNGLNVFKMLPEGAIKFGSYETAKRCFAKMQGVENTNEISPWAQFASGGIGGIAAQFTTYPVDTLRFRMQCELIKDGARGNRLLSETASSMWRAGGIRAYYVGIFWGLVGQFPYSALDLTSYEYLTRWYKEHRRSQGFSEQASHPSALLTAAIGGFSGAFGASMVWPLNLLRTRLQTQGTVVHPQTYSGIVDVFRKTIQGEGWRGLFKGILPNLIKIVPSVSITYVVYDKSKQMFGLE